MELVLQALVIVIQLALGGFVMWGGWLCLREWFRADRAAPRAQAAMLARDKPEDFERAASLVLLALLCTTLVGLA